MSQSPWELQSTDCPSEECHTGQPFMVPRTPTLLGHSKDHGNSMNGAMEPKGATLRLNSKFFLKDTQAVHPQDTVQPQACCLAHATWRFPYPYFPSENSSTLESLADASR